MSGSEALSSALRLLAVRDRSESELAGRLKRKRFSDAAVEAALQRCRELGYLDDYRFALERARSLMKTGRAVGRRLAARLAEDGVPEEAARAAMEEAGREFSEEWLLEDLLQRRFPEFSYEEADERQRRRTMNFFLRRGFSPALILNILKQER